MQEVNPSYASLISVSNTSTDGQLWRLVQAPSWRGASSVSFSSQLVRIDYQERRGFMGTPMWIKSIQYRAGT